MEKMEKKKGVRIGGGGSENPPKKCEQPLATNSPVNGITHKHSKCYWSFRENKSG